MMIALNCTVWEYVVRCIHSNILRNIAKSCRIFTTLLLDYLQKRNMNRIQKSFSVLLEYSQSIANDEKKRFTIAFQYVYLLHLLLFCLYLLAFEREKEIYKNFSCILSPGYDFFGNKHGKVAARGFFDLWFFVGSIPNGMLISLYIFFAIGFLKSYFRLDCLICSSQKKRK